MPVITRISVALPTTFLGRDFSEVAITKICMFLNWSPFILNIHPCSYPQFLYKNSNKSPSVSSHSCSLGLTFSERFVHYELIKMSYRNDDAHSLDVRSAPQTYILYRSKDMGIQLEVGVHTKRFTEDTSVIFATLLGGNQCRK